jgi:hypothetical protein
VSDTDFAGLTEGLCIRFWGKPTETTPKELRWGTGGSRKFTVAKMVWYDHEKREGGGAVDLVMREVGVDWNGALDWMRKEGLIQDRHVAAARQQRQEAPPPTDQPPEQEQPPADGAVAVEKGVKRYLYTDGDGELLYEVVRYQFQFPDGTWQLGKSGNPKKTFRQRRPNGRGGWIWNLDGIGHTIFRRQAVEQAIERGETIFLPEGEKDVETVEGWSLVGSTNSGGAANWRPEFADFFIGADVVILGDDDEAGQKRVDAIARDLKGKAKRTRAIYSWGGPKDVTDWREAGGTLDQFTAMVDSLPDWRPRPPQSKFGAIDLKLIGTGIARKHTWLVQDMIELGGSCALAGFSQSGKSFLTIKLTFAVVMGEPFFGRDVKQGMVVYQLGEGEAGFEKRLEGFMKDKGIDSIADLPLVILPRKINLFSSDEDTDALIAEINAWAEYHQQPCRMVVIDTYNKATRGMNEISGQDNGKVIDRVERIATATGATVMVIDHLSMGGRIRGHGSKTDDMTNTIRVEKDEKKVDNNGRAIRHMILSKNKDGEAGGKVPFVLRQVVVGWDDAGRAITTCVVDPPDGSQEELERSGRLPLNQSLILQTIRDVIAREGVEPPPGVQGVPAGKHVVEWKAVVADLRKKWLYTAPENEPEKRQHELQRIIVDAGKKLQLNGYIDRDNTLGLIWWTGKTDRPLPKPKPIEPAGAGIAPDVQKEIAAMDGVPF